MQKTLDPNRLYWINKNVKDNDEIYRQINRVINNLDNLNDFYKWKYPKKEKCFCLNPHKWQQLNDLMHSVYGFHSNFKMINKIYRSIIKDLEDCNYDLDEYFDWYYIN